MTYTYIQTTDKNGKARFYRVDENGKRKVISRAEYEANAGEQVSLETTETEAPAAEAIETTEQAETCTALAVPFSLDTYQPETAEPEQAAPRMIVLAPHIPSEKLREISEREFTNSIAVMAPSAEELALDTAKRIIEATGNKHVSKVRLQSTKKGVQIRYRNCAICTLEFDAEHNLTGYRFTGTTLETMKDSEVYAPNPLSTYAEDITAQVEFIDWWLVELFKKTAA